MKNGYPKIIFPLTIIFANNQRAVKLIIKNLKYHRKINHISIKYYKTRQLVIEGVVYFKYILT